MSNKNREWAPTKETEDLFKRLNADTCIGPNAPGDGDFIQWLLAATLLVAGEFAKIHGEPTVDFCWDWEEPTRHHKEPVGSWIRRRSRSVADAVIAAIYGPLTETQAQDWNDLCDSILEKQISTQWGGRKVRIPKRRKIEDPQKKIEKALTEGKSFKEAFSLAGVSRATGYRILNRKSKS